MDQREYVVDWEETIRTVFAGLVAGQWHAMPGRLTEDSKDGHNAVVQITVKRMVTDAETGERSYESHPVHPDTIIHFAGGAGATFTHGLAANDEGLIIYASRNVDSWRQSGGEQIPPDSRMAGYQDPHLIPGIRSDPRKLQQVDTKALHARSDDKLHVAETHPDRGHRTFSADPNTPPASADFDPLSQATKFIDHAVQGASGLLGRAVDGSTEHSHGVDHGVGAFMKAMGSGGLHQVLAHPDLGGLLSSADGKHVVQAHPDDGVMISSSKQVSISAPPGMLSFGAGSISGSSVQTGGDLSGTLDEAQVVSLANVDAHLLPAATSDSAASSAGVPIGGLYRDTSIAAGKSVLVVRMA